MAVSDVQIFVSYARKDNAWLRGSDSVGFVSHLLQTELEYEFQKLGDPAPTVWWDSEQVDDGDVFDPKIEQAIEDSSLLVVILSRNWLSSAYCHKEFALFRKRWQHESEDEFRHRVKIVRINHVEDSDWPKHLPPLPKQSGYYFFRFDGPKKEPGRERFFFDRGKPVGSAYAEQAAALGGHLWRAARNIRMRRPPDDDNPVVVPKPRVESPRRGRTIFVAKPSPDMHQAYRRIVRELDEAGYDVAPPPDKDIPFDETATRFIDEALDKAEASIHLLGTDDYYAPAKADRIVKLQLTRASGRFEKSPGEAESLPFRRIIWAPKVLEDGPVISDAAMRDPIAVVENFSPIITCDKIFGDNISAFVVFLRQTLENNAPVPKENVEQAKETSQIYIYHRDVDRRFAVSIAKVFRDKNVAILLPAVDGNDAEREGLHRKYLLDCDRVVLCWASASEAWAKSSAHELKSWQTLGRTRQFDCRGLVVGPPPGEFKADFVDLLPPSEIDVAIDVTGVENLSSEVLAPLFPSRGPPHP